MADGMKLPELGGSVGLKPNEIRFAMAKPGQREIGITPLIASFVEGRYFPPQHNNQQGIMVTQANIEAFAARAKARPGEIPTQEAPVIGLTHDREIVQSAVVSDEGNNKNKRKLALIGATAGAAATLACGGLETVTAVVESTKSPTPDFTKLNDATFLAEEGKYLGENFKTRHLGLSYATEDFNQSVSEVVTAGGYEARLITFVGPDGKTPMLGVVLKDTTTGQFSDELLVFTKGSAENVATGYVVDTTDSTWDFREDAQGNPISGGAIVYGEDGAPLGAAIATPDGGTITVAFGETGITTVVDHLPTQDQLPATPTSTGEVTETPSGTETTPLQENEVRAIPESELSPGMKHGVETKMDGVTFIWETDDEKLWLEEVRKIPGYVDRDTSIDPIGLKAKILDTTAGLDIQKLSKGKPVVRTIIRTTMPPGSEISSITDIAPIARVGDQPDLIFTRPKVQNDEVVYTLYQGHDIIATQQYNSDPTIDVTGFDLEWNMLILWSYGQPEFVYDYASGVEPLKHPINGWYTDFQVTYKP